MSEDRKPDRDAYADCVRLVEAKAAYHAERGQTFLARELRYLAAALRARGREVCGAE